MRIIVNGQQAFGKAVLEALLDRGDEVVAVFDHADAGQTDHAKVWRFDLVGIHRA